MTLAITLIYFTGIEDKHSEEWIFLITKKSSSRKVSFQRDNCSRNVLTVISLITVGSMSPVQFWRITSLFFFFQSFSSTFTCFSACHWLKSKWLLSYFIQQARIKIWFLNPANLHITPPFSCVSSSTLNPCDLLGQ